MTLKVGDFGIDFSGAAITAVMAKQNNAAFMLRYSAGMGNSSPRSQFKLCHLDEIKKAEDAGVDPVANSEWYESRVTEGEAAGRADGKADLDFWMKRGLHKGASIYCSWDAWANPAKFSAVDDYLRGYNAELAGYYYVDAYAGTPYLKHALGLKIIRYGWRTNASSWNSPTGAATGDGLPYQPSRAWILANLTKAQTLTPAAIWQTGNYWFNQGADENVLLRATIGSHLQAADVPVVKPPVVKPPAPNKPTPAPKPTLRKTWPLRSGYFGLITGPPESHGGANPADRPYIKAIQTRLIATKSVTGVLPAWADGKFESPTVEAVKRFQRSHRLTVDGKVGPVTWRALFTY